MTIKLYADTDELKALICFIRDFADLIEGSDAQYT
jgi:hypothetical protein